MCRNGKCWGERDLAPLDFQDRGRFPSVVQVPIFRLGTDGVHAWLLDAVKLPSRARKFHVDAGRHAVRLVVILGPNPRMHPANRAFEQKFVRRPVNVVGQSHRHADGQREHAT